MAHNDGITISAYQFFKDFPNETNRHQVHRGPTLGRWRHLPALQ